MDVYKVYKNFGKDVWHEKVGCLWQEKFGRLINESEFVSLKYVTWPIRNIVQNPRSIRSSRDFESFLVYDEVQIL